MILIQFISAELGWVSMLTFAKTWLLMKILNCFDQNISFFTQGHLSIAKNNKLGITQ